MLRIGEQLCLASSRFGRLNLGSAYCAFSCLQAGAFTYQRMNRHAQRTVEKMLPLMVIFNSIGLFWASGRALNSLSEKFGISFYSERLMQGGWNAPDWSTPKIFFYNFAMTLLAACGVMTTIACVIGPEDSQYQKHAIELFAVCQTALFFFHTSASSILTMAAQAMTAYSSLSTNTHYNGNGKEVTLNSMAVLGALQLALSMLQNRHSFPAKTIFNSQLGLASLLLIYRLGLTLSDLGDNQRERVDMLLKNLFIPVGVLLAFALANSSGNGGNNSTIPTLKKDFGT
ncbi:MAG: hypothetical protein KDK76_03350, partial [Chlamydiia bacterium]|nr:hypothetical protein [Chlamydiia bacterium]